MLRLALIGGLQQAANYQRLASRLRDAHFLALVEPDENVARKMAELLRTDIWSTSVEKLVADHSAAIDAFIVAGSATTLESDSHCAIAAGKHILLPSSAHLSPQALLGIAAAAEQANLRCMWGAPLLFLPSVKTLKQSLDNGQLGVLGLLRMHRWESDPVRTEDRNLLSPLELTCWLFDELPSVVYAHSCKPKVIPTSASQDYLQIHLAFPAGGMALLDHVLLDSAAVITPRDDYFSLSLIGSNGAAYADDHHDMQLLYSQGPPLAVTTRQGDIALLGQLQEFITALAEDREPLPGVAELRSAMEVQAAVAESIATGRAIPLKPSVRDDRE